MNKKKKTILYVILFLLLYFALIANTKAYYTNIDQKLASFDLNNDGVFSIEEQTLEQQKYRDIAISTYRGLFPVIDLFKSLIATGLIFIFLETFEFIVRRRKIDL